MSRCCSTALLPIDCSTLAEITQSDLLAIVCVPVRYPRVHEHASISSSTPACLCGRTIDCLAGIPASGERGHAAGRGHCRRGAAGMHSCAPLTALVPVRVSAGYGPCACARWRSPLSAQYAPHGPVPSLRLPCVPAALAPLLLGLYWPMQAEPVCTVIEYRVITNAVRRPEGDGSATAECGDDSTPGSKEWHKPVHFEAWHRYSDIVRIHVRHQSAVLPRPPHTRARARAHSPTYVYCTAACTLPGVERTVPCVPASLRACLRA